MFTNKMRCSIVSGKESALGAIGGGVGEFALYG